MRRTDPICRCRRYGPSTLPSGRRVFVTHSGLLIGCRHAPAPAVRDLGIHAERMQDLILHRGFPLWATQRLVTALCVGERRP